MTAITHRDTAPPGFPPTSYFSSLSPLSFGGFTYWGLLAPFKIVHPPRPNWSLEGPLSGRGLLWQMSRINEVIRVMVGDRDRDFGKSTLGALFEDPREEGSKAHEIGRIGEDVVEGLLRAFLPKKWTYKRHEKPQDPYDFIVTTGDGVELTVEVKTFRRRDPLKMYFDAAKHNPDVVILVDYHTRTPYYLTLDRRRLKPLTRGRLVAVFKLAKARKLGWIKRPRKRRDGDAAD